jgi:hypothetical protein
MRTKYGAKKTKIDGITCASKKESRRYAELKILLRAKKISNLRLQETFVLHPIFRDENTGKIYRAIKYVCDFFYFDEELQKFIVEDVKGIKTDVYKIKKKLFIKKFQDMYIFKEV